MRGHRFGKKIRARFGVRGRRPVLPPFRMFVDYFLENKSQFQSIYLEYEYSPETKIPTKTNFTLQTNRDKHLRTISGQCDVCNIGVDIVGKSETFDWDMQYLKERSDGGNTHNFPC